MADNLVYKDTIIKDTNPADNKGLLPAGQTVYRTVQFFYQTALY